MNSCARQHQHVHRGEGLHALRAGRSPARRTRGDRRSGRPGRRACRRRRRAAPASRRSACCERRTAAFAARGVTPSRAHSWWYSRPVVAVARIVLRIDDLEVAPGFRRRPILLDAACSMTAGPADQDRLARGLRRRTTCAARSTRSSSPSAIDDARRLRLRGGEHRPHHHAGVVDEARELLRGRRRCRRSAASRRRDSIAAFATAGAIHDQARIERLRDDVVGAELERPGRRRRAATSSPARPWRARRSRARTRASSPR